LIKFVAFLVMRLVMGAAGRDGPLGRPRRAQRSRPTLFVKSPRFYQIPITIALPFLGYNPRLDRIVDRRSAGIASLYSPLSGFREGENNTVKVEPLSGSL
jgi:hypothetical protein